MPEMTGFELVWHVKEFRPDVKVILKTVFDINQAEFAGLLSFTRIAGFVTKPASLKVMRAAIEKCLC